MTSAPGKSQLQEQFIQRAAELKGLAHTVMDRALEAKEEGDDETARRYVEAVNRFGNQLRNADTVSVLKQVGSALANATLDE